MTTTTPSNRPCTCGSYSYLVLVHEGAKGDKVWQRRDTGCADTTHRTFAAGHDSKLKSLLIAAGIGGHQIQQVSGDVVTAKDALRVAADLGWEDIVREGIARGRGNRP
ncbi:hypothetical protein [Streptomyces pini]|nr:hypothetical protein [Streptomyces pini]